MTRVLTFLLAIGLGFVHPLLAADCTDRGVVRFAGALAREIATDWGRRGCAVTLADFEDCVAAQQRLIDNAGPVDVWNTVVGNGGWAQIGPRQLEFEKDLLGDVAGRGNRLWITSMAFVLESVNLNLEKRHGRGETVVTVCKHVFPPGFGMRTVEDLETTQVWSTTIQAGRGNIGKIYIQDIPIEGFALISVHLQGKSVTREMAYTLQVTPRFREPRAPVQQQAAADRDDPDEGAPRGSFGRAVSPPRDAEPDVDLVSSCRATTPSATTRAVQRRGPGLPGRGVPSGIGARPRPALAARASTAEPIVAFTPGGGWVIAAGTRSFARNIPDEAYQRLHQFTDNGKSVDAIAFTPTGGWAIAAEDGYWTRNVGGGYHETVGNLVGQGRRVRDVAFNPIRWERLRGFVIAHDEGFVAENIPREMCDRLKEFTGDGRLVDAVEFTPAGGWAVVVEGGYWTRNVGGSYHGAVGVLIGDDRRVRDIAFRPTGDGIAGWTILTDGAFYSEDVPGELRRQLVETLNLEDSSP